MTRDDGRITSFASSSSGHSNITLKPTVPSRSVSVSSASTKATPKPIKTGDHVKIRQFKEDISPTASGHRIALSPSSTASSSSLLDSRRMSDLTNYRRDLAVLDPSGGRVPQIQRDPPMASPNAQNIAPWMSVNGGAAASPTGFGTSFYNDSSDNVSTASQLSPALRIGSSRNAQASSNDSPDAAYFTDDRRPSAASVTTASSQGSKNSGSRGGFKKLQGFFGEDFPGRDSSETSLPPPPSSQNPGKEQRSYSFNRPRRGRNDSNATDHTREPSPSSSRPRTPVPSSEVVPFLYQEANDIAKYGEAPVRDMLAGPDKERYQQEAFGQIPPKTSSSQRSGHSIVHLSNHHRHHKSNDDPNTLRPVASREDSILSTANMKDRGGSMPTASRSRAQSPTPSSNSTGSRLASIDGQTSPGAPGKRGIFERLRRHKHKDDHRLRGMPTSTRSLAPSSSRLDLSKAQPSYDKPLPSLDSPGPPVRPSNPRQATFNNKFPFAKKGRPHKAYDDPDEHIGPTDRNDRGMVFHLDTNLNDMEGILAQPQPLTPMDSSTMFQQSDFELVEPVSAQGNGAWNAPDSWAVRRNAEERDVHAPEVDDVGTPPRPEEKLSPHCIRVFRADGTFATVQMPLNSTVTDVMAQVVKKTFVTEGLENYHIVLRKHDLSRVLSAPEKPLLIQKRLLQQVGYEEKDRLEDIGREDNGYLCRFLFLSARDNHFQMSPQDLGSGRATKFNHVDLSGRNLITIPITLYSKTGDIISLNLSRNLSLDLPRDFVQACPQLRDIKYSNNEARKLPISIGRAGRLTYLDVSNNRLEDLDHAELGRLTGLLKLSLANNRLNRLPQEFGLFKSLRSLNLSSNFLEKFPVFLCDLESLVDIDVSFNSISSLPDEIGKLRNLEKFVMTNNRLAGSLPSTLRDLINLRELDIKYNTLTAIDIVSELPKLEILSADHNTISQFVGCFERVRNLKLNSNPITKFEITSPVPTLKQLNLSNCQLASIDSSFNNMINLERLVLDRNYFVSLPNTIGNMRRLDHFSIAHNSVGELPPEIGCLNELRVLDIRGNNIRKLPMDIWWANKLETLNASSNVLENFPKPASRPPQTPGESSGTPTPSNKTLTGALSQTSSSEDLMPDGSRRPSQASSTLLSVGPSPVPNGADRKSSVVSVYGKGGRKTSVVSRATTAGSSINGTMTPSATSRKDSGLSNRLTNTFAGSLRNLCLADNQLDDDVFEQLILLAELRVLNLSYNDLSDMPQRCIKNWPQLVELYLSGNDLTSLPVDDLEEYSLLQVLHINNNKFTNLPADISRAKKLAVLDCGNNSLKYNISNVPYDWNWNLNPNLRFLNLSGNKRLEIKQTNLGPGAVNREQYTDFGRLLNLRVLGLMDVTLTNPSIPDQSEDRRVRTSGSLAGHLPYGMADTLGRNEHLSTIDLVVPRFNSSDSETLLGLFDGQALSSGGSKIAKYLHENFGHIFTMELKALKTRQNETPMDALRRAFLALNKDLVTVAIEHTEKRSLTSHRGSSAPVVLSKEDLNSGGVATVAYLQAQELYVANVGDAQAMLIQSDGSHKILTRKHDPAEPNERQRIRDAGGWVSRQGKLNDLLDISRAFGYVDLMPAVQAAPNITQTSITPQDETILIATKELWQYLTPGLIVDVTRSERGDLMRAAHKLRDLAIAYGANGKIMIMMISVADLKRRQERSARLHRGQSMSLYPSGVPDEFQYPIKRGRKAKGEVQDSTLHRLEAEVPAPTEKPSIVFTDIKNSTNLWEMYPSAMRSAIKLHNEVMRRQLRRIGGYEVKTEGDAFMVSFPTATSALLWCFAVQTHLLNVDWPSEILNSVSCQETYDKDNNLIFRGLSVRMGIHFGEPVAEIDPVTRRMDYFGPMVNKASRISSVADGGQITVSADFISEIQRCLETYQEADRVGSTGSDDTFDDDVTSSSIRRELKSLSSQGFEVKDIGERKLKGLENPEYIYSLYPHVLAGRIEHHNSAATAAEVAEKPAMLQAGSNLGIDPEIIWPLWKVSLRLEMLCSTLEEMSGRGLQPPETELLERMIQRGGEVTDRFLFNFMEHQVSRIETCISTLTMRHIAMGSGPIHSLDDLRTPMAVVLDNLAIQMAELERYKAKFGDLPTDSEDDESDVNED
ncbi:PP2C-domain-containing protein [Annulohypoxylon truncatum]|uniref:PP2C-domain-containing protein n=1 Tax=Annulohypoxylon truncatum TaxID=327061 RepID=UPI0020075CF7|nr:PP2C-domain-containing protein [Annulohypoxylon truncatum]KAI1208979.1 PP2C-domain-containing protein [Annulohypoxylon truncatum]